MARVRVEVSETYTEIYHSIGFQRSYSRSVKMDGEKEDVAELMAITLRSLPPISLPVLDSRNEMIQALIERMRAGKERLLLDK